MTIVVMILGVASAAFCIWLIVRAVNQKGHWAKWAIVVAVLTSYPLSFAPASLAVERGWLPAFPAAQVYRPLLCATPKFMSNAWHWYGHALLSRPGCGTLWNITTAELPP